MHHPFPALLAAIVCAVLLSEPPASADAPAGPRLFATDVFSDVATGDRIAFAYRRTTTQPDPRLPEIEGAAEIAVAESETGGRELRVVLSVEGSTRAAPALPAEAGHPLLLIFLESSVRTMAAATGGNPAYIRNRLRDALWARAAAEPVEITVDGAPAAAERLSYRPFASDAHRDEMGPFADLEMRFVLSEAVPGGIAVFEAETAAGDALPGVMETMRFERLGPGD